MAKFQNSLSSTSSPGSSVILWAINMQCTFDPDVAQQEVFSFTFFNDVAADDNSQRQTTLAGCTNLFLSRFASFSWCWGGLIYAQDEMARQIKKHFPCLLLSRTSYSSLPNNLGLSTCFRYESTSRCWHCSKGICFVVVGVVKLELSPSLAELRKFFLAFAASMSNNCTHHKNRIQVRLGRLNSSGVHSIVLQIPGKSYPTYSKLIVQIFTMHLDGNISFKEDEAILLLCKLRPPSTRL